MTTRDAIKAIQQRDAVSEYEAHTTLVDAGYCPDCMKHSVYSRLGFWVPGNDWRPSGRRCSTCNTFHACGTQQVAFA